MPTCWIAESTGAQVGSGAINTPFLKTDTVDFSVESKTYGPFGSNTRLVRLNVDRACSINFGGKDVTATTKHPRLGANQTEPFGVSPGGYLAIVLNI